MVTFHPLKQLYPSALEPIGPNRAKDRRPFNREILIEKFVTKLPHCQSWAAYGMPQPRLLLNHANCRYELVFAAAQRFQLNACRIEIHRFLKPLLSAHKDLIGADDKSPPPILGYQTRFGLGKGHGAIDRRAALGARRPLDRLLVYLGRFYPDLDAGVSQHPGSCRTGRSENQLLTHARRAAVPEAS